MAFQGYNVPLDSGFQMANARSLTTVTTQNETAIDISGAANAFQKFMVLFDWSGLDVATGNESYSLKIEGATDSAFSGSLWLLAYRIIGDSSVSGSSVDTPPAGRLAIYCDNVAWTTAGNADTTQCLRYVRLTVATAAASGTPAITYSAYAVPIQ